MNRFTQLYKIIALAALLITGILLLNFKLHTNSDKRIRYSINKNGWKFLRDDVKGAYKVSFDDKNWLDVELPHDFNGGIDGKHDDVFQGRFDFKNDADKRLLYKGPAWYRTRLLIDESYKNKRIFIEFEAASLEASVWVNSKELGQHQGGYTAFSFDITDFIKFGKPNLLAVRVDNSNNPKIAPWMKDEKKAFPFSFDYAIYGGIYRDVWISITDQLKIEKVFNTPLCGGQGPASVSIDTRVKNYSKLTKKVRLTTSVYDPDNNKIAELNADKHILPGEKVSFSQTETALGKLYYWSPDNPKLYKVKSELSCEGALVDSYESIFGMRYYTLANNQFFSLNGKKRMIHGINRHQDMAGFGYALSNEQHWADAKIIKEAGFNFIRHAHYPCDPEFTRACDELGLMLWLEIPLTGSTSDDPDFPENCKSQLTEMIEQNYNNPSVIVWGIGNESDRSGAPESVSNKVFSELVKRAKDLDQNRPVTGCNFKYESNQKLVDIYAPQDWSGWYNASISEYNPTSLIGEYGADSHFQNHSEEKFDITKDYASAQNPECWSQEYAAYLHEYKVAHGESVMDNFPGHFVWVAFDFASPRADRGTNPLPYMNQKGLLLHDHKTKKDAYYFYQSMYRKAADFPMVYIVSHSWTNRWTKPEAKDIWVYSNCDSVELFNDYGELSFGKRLKNAGPKGNTRFQWDSVPVNYNVLYAEAWFNNQLVARDTIILQNLPAKE